MSGEKGGMSQRLHNWPGPYQTIRTAQFPLLNPRVLQLCISVSMGLANTVSPLFLFLPQDLGQEKEEEKQHSAL